MDFNNLNPPNFKPSLAMMREISIFKSFTDAEMSRLIGLGKVEQHESETNILIEGEPSWGLYMILSGEVAVLKTNKLNANLFEIGRLKAGDFFGEMSFLDESPRSATVKTVTESRLFYLSKEQFSQFIDATTDIKLRFLSGSIQTLVRRLRELDENYVTSQYQLWRSVLHKEVNGK